jgi:Alr-MurF fusion protein
VDPVDLPALADLMRGELVGGTPDRTVRHATIHSDHIRSGSAFFALRGAQTDGHRFVDRALANGAVVAVVSARQVGNSTGTHRSLVVVDDPHEALRALARWWRAQLSATVVAVVGNVGKTVTKDALVSLHGWQAPTFGSPGSLNSQLGVPLSLLACPRDARVAVFEAAATAPGEMARLRDLVDPSHVVLTNIGTRWEADAGGPADQAGELLNMASGLADQGWLLIGEAAPALRHAAATLATPSYLVGESADLPRFGASRFAADRMVTDVTFPDGRTGTLTVVTPSEQIAGDVHLAVCAAWLLGVPSTALLEAARDYTPTSARMETWRSPSGVTVIRDVATVDGATFAGAARVARRLTGDGGATVVVLADRYDQVGAEVGFALGQTIGRAGIDQLCTLRTKTHQSIVDGVRSTDPTLDIRMLGSVAQTRHHLVSTRQSDDVVLVQSPRTATLADLTLTLVEPMASTRLYIDQSAVESNVASFRRLVGPQVQVMGMVKALAYGTNPVQLSRCLEAAGIDALAVASVDEGVALRQAGVALDTILVTLAARTDLDRMARHRLTPLVYSPDILAAVLRLAEERGPRLSIHLEVDSGMHRTGLHPDEATAALRKIRARPGLHLAGLMTHFACADLPEQDELTLTQLARFERVVDQAHRFGFDGFLRHAANTAATIRLPGTRLDLVRIGIGLFGVAPSPDATTSLTLTPAVRLVGTIVEVHELAPGEPVGYGATFRTAPGGSRIAVVAAGYHDCIPRTFANVGSVVVHGRACPIVGAVSMDSMTIDVSGCPDATVGSEVVIYGGSGDATLSIEEVAARAGTIPYELLARIGPRVQRVFTRH